jgi:hypothetical protein
MKSLNKKLGIVAVCAAVDLLASTLAVAAGFDAVCNAR